jgi:RimJ/RimL family protein N-acetyltransferase
LRYHGTTGEVSHWVDRSARGRGVATRALRLLSDWAFAALELSEIELWTHVDNAPSGWWRNAPAIDALPTTTTQN